MATILRIKRSSSTGSPTSLKLGELAYTYLSGTQSNGGDRLYIGTGGTDSDGDANNIDIIGGKYFTDMLDHVAGTLTASSAIITDTSNKIDNLKVDNLDLNGNAITSTDTNGNISLTPNGTGEVVASTLTVSDLTNNRIVLAGTSGALEDDANLTFDGSTLSATAAVSITGATDITGDLDVDNININGNTIISTDTNGDITISPNGTGTVVIDTDLDVDNVNINGNTISTTNSNGDLNLSPNGTGTVVVNTDLTVDNININASTIALTGVGNGDLAFAQAGTGTYQFAGNTAVKLPVGTDAQRPTAATGQIRFNTTASQFEGYDGNNWSGLGGVIDADQDTKITAEQTSGSDSDALKFFTAGTLRMQLDSSELALHNVTTISSKTGSSLTIDPNPVGDSGELVVLGNLKVEGTTTTINSVTVSLNDKNLVLADSAADSAEANNAGITINGPSVPATLLYKSATDTFQFNRPLTTPGGGVTNIISNYTTDNLTEGSSNLYFTNERVDDRLNSLLLAGEAIDLTYDDAANTLQIDVELATKSNPGAASFDSDQMTVTAGAVTITELDGGTY